MRLLHSYGKHDIIEYDYELPPMTDDQIKIKTIYCGVCRSDIGAYSGAEEPMPFGNFGHEGLGEVVEVGKNLAGEVKVGEIVATWSDPAYGDYYYANINEFTIVPEVSSKFILQPVACAMNIIDKTLITAAALGKEDQEPILLMGTGYMSIIIGQYLKNSKAEITVCGSSNRDIWEAMGYDLVSVESLVHDKRKFGIIIDLTSKAENFHIITKQLASLEALICYAATPFTPVTTNFFENCWNCHTIIMPSPRNLDFSEIMEWTRDLIIKKVIDPSKLWSKSYNRNDMNEVKQAFEDGVNRPKGYLRGYLRW